MRLLTIETKNYDKITIDLCDLGYFYVYFNTKLIEECLSYSSALRVVESQMSL